MIFSVSLFCFCKSDECSQSCSLLELVALLALLVLFALTLLAQRGWAAAFCVGLAAESVGTTVEMETETPAFTIQQPKLGNAKSRSCTKPNRPDVPPHGWSCFGIELQKLKWVYEMFSESNPWG